MTASSETGKKAIITRLLTEVWSEGNTASVQELVADRYTIRHDPGDPWEGRELDQAGYIDRVEKSRAPFPDQSFDIQTLHEDGSTVVVTWLWSGTHLGEIPGFPTSGKVIRMSGATVYHFFGSKVSGHWQVTDRLSVYRQLSGQ